MQYSVVSVLSFATSALAQIAGFDAMTKPTQDETIAAGSTYTIKWEPNDVTGKIDISLLGGATSSTLDILSKIAEGINNQVASYEWSVASDLGDKATYGIQINLQTNETMKQYSFPFTISESDDSTNSSSTSSVSSTGTASSNSTTKTSTISTSSSTVTNGAKNSTMTSASSFIATATTTTKISTSSTASSTPASVTTNAAAPLVGNTFALIGGLAAAVFAL